jgi:hypothetical protein
MGLTELFAMYVLVEILPVYTSKKIHDITLCLLLLDNCNHVEMDSNTSKYVSNGGIVFSFWLLLNVIVLGYMRL